MTYSSCKLTSHIRRVFILCALAVIMVLIIFTGISNADLTEMTKLVPGDGAYNDLFGSSVSIRGDYAIVGAPNDDEGILKNSGCAYIYERSGSTWSEKPKILAEDRSPNDIFGSSVSISGDYAIVGKPFDDHTGSDYGSVYIFQRIGTTWSKVAKLVADDGGTSDYFGSSVYIAGNYAIVGAPFDDDKGANSGSAYIFERSEDTGAWSQVKKLIASDGAGGDNFGYSVSISGNYAIVGAPRDDNGFGVDAGSVYFFQRSEGVWGNEQKLVDINHGDDNDLFGWSVALYGNTGIVGAYQDDDSGDDTGSATIVKYWNNTWLPSYYLTAPDRSASDYFGYSVSISADCVLIGAFGHDSIAADAGAAYVFQKTSEDDSTPVTEWDPLVKLIASDGATGDKFGVAVSISGPYAIVGAKWDMNSAGSAYVYNIFAGPSPPSSKAMPAIPLLLLED